MQLQLRINSTNLLVLLDSGSTHNFMVEQAAGPLIFHVATLSIANEHFMADCFNLPLAGYNVVLDTHWLTSLGQTLWDFGTIIVSFWQRDHHVSWQGITFATCLSLHACSNNEHMAAFLQEFHISSSNPLGYRRLDTRTTALT